MNTEPRHILITGASGGLGSALARTYAAPGLFLSLWGRNQKRLEQTAALCREAGAETGIILQDIRDARATRAALLASDEARPLDMAVLNAGISAGVLPDGRPEPAEDACRTMEVNATGAINMAAALLERMTRRGGGHIVFIASLAAFYPLPSSPSYCAAKAAVSYYARALRAARTPARVSIVYPGYVETPMSRRLKGPQPFLWKADAAAAHIRGHLQSGSDTIVFPKLLALGTWSLNLLPRPLAAFFAKRFAFTVEPDAESPLAEKSHSGGEGGRG